MESSSTSDDESAAEASNGSVVHSGSSSHMSDVSNSHSSHSTATDDVDSAEQDSSNSSTEDESVPEEMDVDVQDESASPDSGGSHQPSSSNSDDGSGDGDDSSPGDSDGSSGPDDDPPPNLRESATRLIAKLRSCPTTTRTCVTTAVTEFERLAREHNERMCVEVRSYLDNRNLLHEAASVELLQKLRYVNPFKGMMSKKGQLAAIKKTYEFVAPRTIHLGHRVQQVRVAGGQYRPRPVRENFQYVPLKEVLKRVYSKAQVREYAARLRQPNGLLQCYSDGNQYQQHPFLQRFPSAFQLVLYFDDLEVANALGSKGGIHNVGAFYVMLLNTPPFIRSQLGSIFLLALANYQDIKERGFRDFLRPFLEDLQDLESEEGVAITVDGEAHTLRATMVAFTGDTKAAHEIMGFIGGRANLFCRLCTISRNQLHEGNVLIGDARTRALHDQHLQLVHANPQLGPRETGVKEDSPLHDCRFWHCTNNKVFDPMHDLGEGIIGMVVLLLLWHFISEMGYFHVWDFNRRIHQFNYGKADHRNKPSANFSEDKIEAAETVHSIRQSSAQSFCLLRAFPFLLDGLGVPDEDPYMALLTLLRKIVDISFAPKLHRDIMPYFRRILLDFRTLFRELFPQVHEINKMHHIQHYPDCMEEVGPLRQFSCMRPEAQHQPLKAHVVACKNYKNVPRTAAEHLQIANAMAWGTHSDNMQRSARKVSGIRQRDIHDLPTFPFLRAAAVGNFVETANAAELNGFLYSIGDFILTRSQAVNANELHAFGKVVGIIVRPDTLWLEIQEWSTVGFSERLSAYIVEEAQDGPVHLLDPNDLPLHPPLSAWTDFTTDSIYLSLKYFVI